MGEPLNLSTRIDTSPEEVYAALSQSRGLASFWTTDSQAEPVVGSIARFGFPNGSRLEIRVDALEPGRRVVWTPLNNLLTWPPWVGTTITWDLVRTESGSTNVLFEQGYVTDAMPSAEAPGIAYFGPIWAQILQSLKGYVETDTPQPFFKSQNQIEVRSMPEILFELVIGMTPDKVYAAVTEAEGLSGWWAPEVVARPEVGSIAEFGFPHRGGGKFVARMEVTALEPGRKVVWTVKDGPPEWLGTRITWGLSPLGKGTRVLFGHHDYPSTEGSFAGVSFSWAWYLMSLTDYLETGKGRPGQYLSAERVHA